MFKKTFCSIMLLFITTLLYAGSFSFNVSVDKNTVALNESFTYSVTVSADGKNLPQHQIDAMPEFTKYGQEISIINDEANMSITHTYTLVPKRTGKFTIPPAKIIFDNKTHLTESIEVEVTPAKKSADHNQKSGSNHHKNAFVRASVNKKTVYENEKLVYKFGFYANVNLASNSNNYSSPDFSGFWNDGSKQRESYFQVVDGLKYIASETETVLYPIGAGLKTISPAKFEIDVPDTVDNFFSGFGSFMNIGRSQTKILETEKIEVKVLPLPQEGKPYDFSGGVGDFKIKGSVDKKDASTNDPITLTVTVSGEGNMKSIKDIKFNSCDGFKKYDTIVANTSDNSKEFKTIFIPLTAGEKEIPYASLSFFNPAKKQYEDVKTQPLKITVSAKPSYFNDATSNDATFSDIAKNTSKINKVRNDINYNKQIKELKLYNGHFIKNPAFYLMFVPFIVLLFFSIGYRLHVNRTRGNKSKKLKGYSFANVFKLIHEAQTNIANDSFNIALSKIYEALIEIVNIKTGILSANLQSLQISSNLAESGVGNEIISKILGVLERINFYKFASSSPDKDSLNALIGEVRAIVANLKK